MPPHALIEIIVLEVCRNYGIPWVNVLKRKDTAHYHARATIAILCRDFVYMDNNYSAINLNDQFVCNYLRDKGYPPEYKKLKSIVETAIKKWGPTPVIYQTP